MESVETRFVRLAVTDDLPSLVESDAHANNHPERQSFLAAAIERGECLVAFVGKHVVGYIVLNYSFFGRGFIPLVVVAPSHRATGAAWECPLDKASGLEMAREAIYKPNSAVAAQKCGTLRG